MKGLDEIIFLAKWAFIGIAGSYSFYYLMKGVYYLISSIFVGEDLKAEFDLKRGIKKVKNKKDAITKEAQKRLNQKDDERPKI